MSSKWPIEDQQRNPLARARHVANMYRTALQVIDPSARMDVDRMVEGFGETWILERVVTYSDTDELDSTRAAEALGITLGALRKLRERGRLTARKANGTYLYSGYDIRTFRNLPAGRPVKDQLPEG